METLAVEQAEQKEQAGKAGQAEQQAINYREALDRLFHDGQYLHLLRRMALNLCRRSGGLLDESMAEDLVQETVFSAWKYVDSFQGRSKLETWIFRIQMNAFQNLCRQSRHRGALQEEYENRMKKGDFIKTQEAPLSSLIKKECIEILKEVICTLPDNQSAALTLELHGKNLEEIRDIMGKSGNQLRGVMYRARKDLGAALLSQGLVVKNRGRFQMAS